MTPTGSRPHRLGSATRPAWRSLTRFRRCRDGATAVEFGMVAMPFLLLMFAIIEAALTFWSTQVLETAVANASRQIYTGQFQQQYPEKGTMTSEEIRDKFKELVCANVTALFNCNELVSIDVRTAKSDSSDATAPPPIKDGKYDASGYGYKAPTSNEITIVRAAMEYPVFVNVLGPSNGLASGKRLIMATATFRTEPYSK